MCLAYFMVLFALHTSLVYILHAYFLGLYLPSLYLGFIFLLLTSWYFSPKLSVFFCSCHNFFSLSSVKIIFIPACCLLCVL